MSSGGNGRSTAQEVRDDAAENAEPDDNGQARNGSDVASNAYEVAAALRARAAKGGRSASSDEPQPEPAKAKKSESSDNASKAPEPAVERTKPSDDHSSTAARSETTPSESATEKKSKATSKADRRSEDAEQAVTETVEHPAPAKPAATPAKAAASADTASGTATEAPAAPQPPKPRPEQRAKPVPPPSLVAEQASATTAPPLPVDPSGQVEFTEVGTEPVKETRTHQRTTPRRPARVPAARRTVRVRKARLRLMRVDPWSVMKTAFLLSVALGITLFVAVAVLWSVLDAAGVFDSVRQIVTDFTASDSNSGVDINQYIELSRVLGFTTLIAVIDIVLVTALATLGAFLYNLSASLLGGLEVTLAEDD